MLQFKMRLTVAISLIVIAWGRFDGYAQVTVTLASIHAQPDSVIKVPVLVSDLTSYGIIAYQFKVIYDAMLIRALGVSAERTLTAPWGNAVANVDTAGMMIIGAFGVTALSRGDTLINLVFQVLSGSGDSSALWLEEVRFNKDYPQATVVNGVVKIVLPTRIDRDHAQVNPRTMYLVSNYPDPFQTKTSIRIKNLESGRIRVLIVNVLGQRIKQIGSFNPAAGVIESEWDATDDHGVRAPAGIYFSVVQNEGQIIGVERMILIE